MTEQDRAVAVTLCGVVHMYLHVFAHYPCQGLKLARGSNYDLQASNCCTAVYFAVLPYMTKAQATCPTQALCNYDMHRGCYVC